MYGHHLILDLITEVYCLKSSHVKKMVQFYDDIGLIKINVKLK